jgi:hypothetical protein
LLLEYLDDDQNARLFNMMISQDREVIECALNSLDNSEELEPSLLVSIVVCVGGFLKRVHRNRHLYQRMHTRILQWVQKLAEANKGYMIDYLVAFVHKLSQQVTDSPAGTVFVASLLSESLGIQPPNSLRDCAHLITTVTDSATKSEMIPMRPAIDQFIDAEDREMLLAVMVLNRFQ